MPRSPRPTWVPALSLLLALPTLVTADGDRGAGGHAARRLVAAPREDGAAAYRSALGLEAHGRADEARRAYERVLAADPDHRAARRALGFERVGERWLSGAALRRARGFVHSRGRWLLAEEAPPDEADALRLRQAAAGLASDRSADRARAAAAIARIGDERGIPLLVAAWARVASGAPAGYFAQTRQMSYVEDFETEVC